jgi:hypothetical protein
MNYNFRRYLWSGLWRTPLCREPLQAHHAYLERLTANVLKIDHVLCDHHERVIRRVALLPEKDFC